MLEPIRLRELRVEDLAKIIGRNRMNLEAVKVSVLKVLTAVRCEGDAALLRYTSLYDGVELTAADLKVTSTEIKAAYSTIPPAVVRAIKKAARNIREIHRKQMPRNRVLKRREGVEVKQVFMPLGSVGLYVPGGKASYPSTALMLGIPANIAGVQRLVACTPPTPPGKIDPAVLVALNVAGVGEIYKLGGAQAVAAMAYGTQSIPRVDKVIGPGNIYLTAAKLLVAEEVGIDFPAGPTEVVIFADDTADPTAVAADMLSQAEHDTAAVALLVTTSERVAVEVKRMVESMLPTLDRRETAERSLTQNGAILLAKDMNEAWGFINSFAPEHLEITAENAPRLVAFVKSAGSISLGSYTPVAATDYAVGSSHVLPTGGSARYHAGITVYDFLRPVNVQKLSRSGLKRLAATVNALALKEGLTAHAKAVEERFKYEDGG